MFLVTVNHHSLFKKDIKNLFAGQWCYDFKNSEQYKNIEYEFVPFLFDNISNKDNEMYYLLEIYEKILDSLCNELNKYLNLNENKEYYRIILGYWLMLYIHRIYFQYKTIEYIKNNYNNLETFTLDQSQYIIPLGSIGYHLEMDKHLYNLQTFSELIDFFDISNTRILVDDPLKQNLTYKIHFGNEEKNDFIKKENSKSFNKKITIVNGYFNNFINSVKEINKYTNEMIFDDFEYSFYNLEMTLQLDNNFRKQKIKINKKDLFLNFIEKNILQNIPVIYVEGHIKFLNWIEKQNIPITPYFYTANSLYSNDFFKFFIAKNRKNIKVFSHQHGSAYGFQFLMFPEIYERQISDIFFTLGWSDSKKTKYLPLEKMHIPFSKKTNEDIVFLLCDMHKYIVRFFYQQNSSQVLKDTVEMIINIFNNIEDKNFFRMRFYPSNLGWDIKQRIYSSHFIPEIESDFNQIISESKLIIHDHIGTSFLQRIALNKPTIVIINTKTVKFREEAKELFDKLKKVGILHTEYKTTIPYITMNNINTWWGDRTTQKIVKEFCNVQNRISKNWALEFTNTLKNEMENLT